MIDEIGPGLWAASAPLRLAGAAFGTRMTIVRIGRDGLALIAPIEIDDALANEIAELGEVRALIAPNAFHHFYFLAAAKRYPGAACFLAEGVEKKLGERPAGAKDLTNEADPLWQDELRQIVLEGVPLTNEVVFLHAASRTLIVTDICFNFEESRGAWTSFFLSLTAARKGMKVSRLMRASIKDKAALRASIDRILEWDFDNVIVTHGEIARGGGHERFRAATEGI